jgi:hypothetical protein
LGGFTSRDIDWWARYGVRVVASVQIEEQLGGSVQTRDSNSRRVGRTRASDGEFSTMDVWLGPMKGAGFMQGNDLSTKKIVAWGDVCGDGDAAEHTPISYQVIHAPLHPRGIQPLVPYLEPDVPCSRVRLGQVHHTWTVMAGRNHVIACVVGPPLEAYG